MFCPYSKCPLLPKELYYRESEPLTASQQVETHPERLIGRKNWIIPGIAFEAMCSWT